MKSAVVTGARGGIGSVICRKLLSEGWAVTGIDKAENVKTIESKNYTTLQFDLSDSHSVKHAAHLITKQYPCLNLLLNCAAVQHVNSIKDMTDQMWDDTLAVNVRSVWQLAKYLHCNLENAANEAGWSSVIHISSIHAYATSEGMAAYAASKAALNSLTRSLSIEFANSNIRVNSITPGAVATPMLFEHLNRNQISKLLDKQLVKELIPPDSLADLVLFLLSKGAANITGQDFIIDSGVLPQLLTEA